MQIASGSFSRVSPVKFSERGGLPMGWIVLRHEHVRDKLSRRKTHARWVRVTSSGYSVFRALRYSVNLRADQIVMDWAGWIDLQGRTDEESETLQLTITTAQWWQFITIPFRHVDPAYRLATWIAAISLFLGVVSLAVSFYPIFQSPRAAYPPAAQATISAKPSAAQTQPAEPVHIPNEGSNSGQEAVPSEANRQLEK